LWPPQYVELRRCAMRCPYCGSLDDRVVDSRSSKEGRAIRRRRECTGCSKRFTTYEYIEDVAPIVVKSDGRREPFDRGKIIQGIRIACTKRPIATSQIEELVDEIEAQIERTGEKEISTEVIGEMVMEGLRGLDEVAYVRFASVYREFRDRSEFLRELEQLDGHGSREDPS